MRATRWCVRFGGLPTGSTSTAKDFFIKKGAKGYGFALRDEPDGVYINRLKAGSTSLEALGKAMTNSKVQNALVGGRWSVIARVVGRSNRACVSHAGGRLALGLGIHCGVREWSWTCDRGGGA